MAVNRDIRPPSEGSPSSKRLLEKALERDMSSPPPPLPTTHAQLAVATNIINNLGYYFAKDPGGVKQFVLNADLHPSSRAIKDGHFEIVSWEWVGIHGRSFRGVPATGRPVWFRGLTVAENLSTDDDPRYRFHQFIDWREVLLQLGIAPEGVRPLVGQEDLARLPDLDLPPLRER